MSEAGSFVCPPPMEGDWEVLDAAALSLAVRLMEAHAGRAWRPNFLGAPLRGRALALPFYGDAWSLIDLEGRTVDGHGACAMIVGEDHCEPVTGGSPPIHELNARLAPALGEGSPHLSAYLQFFTAMVWGEDGPFRICQSTAQAAAWIETAEPVPARKVRARRYQSKPCLEADLIYGDQAYTARFEVTATGMVSMLSDSERGAGRRRVLVRPPLRVVPFRVPGVPE